MITFVTGTIGIAVAILIVLLIRKDQLHVRHGLAWLVVASCFAVLGVFPGLIDSLASLTGVSYPPILGITVALALGVVKILLMDIERSRIEMHNLRLIQPKFQPRKAIFRPFVISIISTLFTLAQSVVDMAEETV